MVSPILPIAPVPVAPVSPLKPSSSPAAFQDVFAGAIRQVESAGQQASGSVERFLAGEGEELHNTVLAATRAQLTFEMFLQMRNKIVGAYQEIMKMQM